MEKDRICEQLIAAYLEPWSTLASPATLRSQLQMALWVAPILQALDFALMFGGDDEESIQRWQPLIGDPLTQWLNEPPPFAA